MNRSIKWFDLDLAIWECEQEIMEGERWCPEKTRRPFDPHKDRLFKARKRASLKWGGYGETKYARNKIQSKFQMKMKQNLYAEEYYSPVPHDYKTYGWETW